MCLQKKLNNIEEKTAELYADMWEYFSDEDYVKFAETIWIQTKMDIIQNYIVGKSILDAGGGGGGRASYMFLKRGASKVTALDISEKALEHTRRICKYSPYLKTQQGSLLNIPFPNNSFDFVYCSGVIHHAEDPFHVFTELVRVLKPSGFIHLGVYGSGGVITGLLIPFVRLFRNIIPYSVSKRLLKMITDPKIRYYILDSMYVPIRENYAESEIRKWFDANGLKNSFRIHSTSSFNECRRWLKGEGFIMMTAQKQLSEIK